MAFVTYLVAPLSGWLVPWVVRVSPCRIVEPYPIEKTIFGREGSGSGILVSDPIQDPAFLFFIVLKIGPDRLPLHT